MTDEILNPPINEIAAALAKAQAEITPPTKSHVAKVPTKSGGAYEYHYSTLDELIEALRMPLSKHGLAFYQHTICQDHTIGVETVVLHTSGQSLHTGYVILPCGDTPQSLGSGHTYARRYSLGAAFGVCPVSDDDAGEAQRTVTRTAPPVTTATLPPVVPPPPVVKASELLLTQPQIDRLKALMKTHGVKALAIKQMLAKGGITITTAADIRQKDYDDICAWVVSDGR